VVGISYSEVIIYRNPPIKPEAFPPPLSPHFPYYCPMWNKASCNAASHQPEYDNTDITPTAQSSKEVGAPIISEVGGVHSL